jgi:hypothetical protein
MNIKMINEIKGGTLTNGTEDPEISHSYSHLILHNTAKTHIREKVLGSGYPHV